MGVLNVFFIYYLINVYNEIQCSFFWASRNVYRHYYVVPRSLARSLSLSINSIIGTFFAKVLKFLFFDGFLFEEFCLPRFEVIEQHNGAAISQEIQKNKDLY